jgi:hypothetical protein
VPRLSARTVVCGALHAQRSDAGIFGHVSWPIDLLTARVDDDPRCTTSLRIACAKYG